MTHAILGENEVFLYGEYFKILKPVTPRLVSPWGGRIVIGDPSRSDQQVISEWIMADWRGGMLVYDMDEKVHPDRFWYSECLTMFKKQLTLPFKTTATGNGSMTSIPVIRGGLEYASNIYFCFDTYVKKWNTTTLVWDASRTLQDAPTDSIVFNGAIYWATGDEYDRYDGSTWTTINEPINYFCKFDDMLIGIGNDCQLKYSVDGVNWSYSIYVPVENGFVTDLEVYYDPSGAPAIYIGTKTGVYIVDFYNEKVHETALQYAKGAYSGKMMKWKDGYLYVADGIQIYRFANNVISSIGLDKEDSLPNFMRGNIVGFAKSPNWLLAIGSSDTTLVTSDPADLVYQGTPEPSVMGIADTGYSYILLWTGIGWHLLTVTDRLTAGNRAAFTSDLSTELRLWFGEDGEAKYMVVPEGSYNPIRDPNALFLSSRSAYHETAWFDGGFSECPKIAASLKAKGMNLFTDEDAPTTRRDIKIYYGINDDEGWTYLGTLENVTSSATGAIDKTQTFYFGSRLGTEFYNIRFRFELYTSDETETPALIYASLRFLKIPEIVEGWGFQIDCTKEHRGKSPAEQIRLLRNIARRYYDKAAQRTLGEFIYRDLETGASDIHYVSIANMAGTEWTGTEERAIFDITVVEPTE